MYTSMKEMLLHARDHNYAVMAINVVNMEQVKACIESAEEEHSAVILNISPRQMKAHAYPYIMAPMVRDLAERASVPVALNIDHGVNMEDIVQAIHCGYSSVMVDASSYEFEENIRRVRAVVSLAHAKDISVEAELGHVGVAANADGQNADYYTNVAQAAEFVRRTGCDCLAIAIGTAHGSYPKNMIPNLDFDRLEELKHALDVPLVLHGGSGAGEANIKKAVALGINKINVCTDLMNHAKDSMLEILKEEPDIQYMELNEAVEESMKAFIKDYMRMIGSSGRYQFEVHKGAELD